MEYVVFLRGVTPKGRNSIPKMSYLAEILKDAGFGNVRTYIQSGNIILNSDLTVVEIAFVINNLIKERIGADLKVIIKTKKILEKVVQDNPFCCKYDYSRIHVIFCQNKIDNSKLQILDKGNEEEKIVIGDECIYLYLPRNARKKRLNTNFLERKLKVDLTMRKLNVVNKLIEI